MRKSNNKSLLTEPILVLNKNWQAINSTTARRALKSVCCNKAAILCPKTYVQHDIISWMDLSVPDDKPGIRTTDGRIAVPEIIVNKYDKFPRKKVVFNRRNLFMRDQFCCQYCGVRPPSDDWTIDHVVPKSQKGTTRFDNCVVACTKCNRHKADRTPEQAGMKLRRMEMKNGELQIVFYDRPSAPKWNPAYNMRRMRVPPSWAQFLTNLVSEMYWTIELED